MKYCRTSNHQHLLNLEESAAMTDSSFFAMSDTLISVLNNRTTPLTSLQESLDSLYRRRWTHEQIIVHGLPFIGGFSANKGFCRRVFVHSGTIGRCLHFPLLVDFPPIKGFRKVYADKKAAARTGKIVYEFPRSEGILPAAQHS